MTRSFLLNLNQAALIFPVFTWEVETRRLALLHQKAQPLNAKGFATNHYRLKQRENEGMMIKVIERYVKGVPMFDMKAFRQKCNEEMIAKMPVELRLKDLSPEERVKGLSYDQLRALLDKCKPQD